MYLNYLISIMTWVNMIEIYSNNDEHSKIQCLTLKCLVNIYNI